jgi:hypothetical protein
LVREIGTVKRQTSRMSELSMNCGRAHNVFANGLHQDARKTNAEQSFASARTWMRFNDSMI